MAVVLGVVGPRSLSNNPYLQETRTAGTMGEGSGAALALPLLRAAAAVVTEMGTLKEAVALGPP